MSRRIACRDHLLYRLQALRIHRRMRWVIPFIALSMLALIGSGWKILRSSGQQGKSYTPRLTANQITELSLAFCARFSDNVRQVSKPQFHDEIFDYVPGNLRHRPVWTTHCVADGNGYYIQFNDLTGNLTGLMPESSVMEFVASEHGEPLIKTPREAASVASQRLVEMRLVPQGTRAALITAPKPVANGRAWQMVWQARPPAPAPAYEINMVLARVGGVPIMVLDRSELAQYASQ